MTTAELPQPTVDGASAERPTVPRWWRAVDAVSTLATRVSFVVIAWLLLAYDQSWVRIGLVLTVQAVAYLAGGPLATALLDRLGADRVALAADLTSALALASVAFFTNDLLGLAVLVAALGLLRAASDLAKLVLAGAAAAVDSYEDTSSRTPAREWLVGSVVLVAGAAIGAAAAWLGPVGALWLVAVSLAGCAAMIVRAAPNLPAEPVIESAPPPGEEPPPEPTLTDLRRLPLAQRLAVVTLVTGVFALTGAVILGAVWVRDVFTSPEPLGVLGGAFVLAAIGGSVVFTAAAAHPLRYLLLALGYLIGGGAVAVRNGLAPTELLVVAVAMVVGLATASVVPVLGLLVANRIPTRLRSRVGALAVAVTAVGIPLAAFAGGWLAEHTSVLLGVALGAACYLVAMLVPVFAYRTWQELVPAAEMVSILRRWPKLTGRLAVTLAYADGQWLVEVRRGRALLGSRHAVGSAEALSMLSLLNVPALSRGVEAALVNDKTEASRQVDRVRGELAELEAKLTGLNEMVELNDATKPNA